MKKLPFVLIMIMCFFALVLMVFKVFFDQDLSWGQCFMPVWIGIPVISLFRYLFHIGYEA